MMKLRVTFNKEFVALRDIKLPAELIKAGDVFLMKDAYKEGVNVFIGVDSPAGVMEAGFIVPKGKKIKSRKDVMSFVERIALPYIKGASYTIISPIKPTE